MYWFYLVKVKQCVQYTRTGLFNRNMNNKFCGALFLFCQKTGIIIAKVPWYWYWRSELVNIPVKTVNILSEMQLSKTRNEWVGKTKKNSNLWDSRDRIRQSIYKIRTVCLFCNYKVSYSQVTTQLTCSFNRNNLCSWHESC